MAQIRTFKDLKVWQKAHELALAVYQTTKHFPVEEKFGLITQLRRAAVSVVSNLVEGFRRKSLKDSLNFYNIADSSLEELKYQLILSRDLKFIAPDQFNNIYSLTEEVGKMLCRWTQSHKSKLK